MDSIHEVVTRHLNGVTLQGWSDRPVSLEDHQKIVFSNLLLSASSTPSRHRMSGTNRFCRTPLTGFCTGRGCCRSKVRKLSAFAGVMCEIAQHIWACFPHCAPFAVHRGLKHRQQYAPGGKFQHRQGTKAVRQQLIIELGFDLASTSFQVPHQQGFGVRIGCYQVGGSPKIVASDDGAGVDAYLCQKLGQPMLLQGGEGGRFSLINDQPRTRLRNIELR